uniref:Uncharacterized protein AlNc14C68G4776 n=1 Tax=Albugo laibachii Nc14 TaxID=890382 RepID=F0WDQ5_9STRA|nr:conserved hypothetical protein [Albugo laibachii Nc14]|eukprot:CCA19332.1 conserved hypothetical protein [Albugo laibachii Nc14]
MRMGPYIRVKRQHQTVFLDVQLSDTLLSVKEAIASIFHIPSQNIQLWQGLNQKTSKELSNTATIEDYGITNDAVIYMCWKKANSDQWEDLSVTTVDIGDNATEIK